MPVTLACLHCGATIRIKPSCVTPTGNFCSKPCAYAHRRKHPDQTCEQCRKTFRPIARGSLARFCSNDCYAAFRQSLPPEQRAELMANATARIRGAKRSHDDLCKRARTKQDRAVLSADESEIMAALRLTGLNPIPVYAIDKYNIDLAFPDQRIAVEYNGGNWHNTPQKMAEDQVKSAFLAEHGWTLLVFPRLLKRRRVDSGNARIALADLVSQVDAAVHR